MTRGLLAPLDPQEEVALRRIAHGSVVVDAQITAKLVSLALVEHVHTSLRLTPLGRLRFNALPKAPLLMRQRSVQTASEYVSAVIEKAQGIAKCRQVEQATAPPVSEAASPPPAEPEDQDDTASDEDSSALEVVASFGDPEYWKSRAEQNMAKIRRIMIEHRERQQRLCDDSYRRIAMSQLLLKATVPATSR
jgi:hypothetical protein